jgi:hypothetical protein
MLYGTGATALVTDGITHELIYPSIITPLPKQWSVDAHRLNRLVGTYMGQRIPHCCLCVISDTYRTYRQLWSRAILGDAPPKGSCTAGIEAKE